MFSEEHQDTHITEATRPAPGSQMWLYSSCTSHWEVVVTWRVAACLLGPSGCLFSNWACFKDRRERKALSEYTGAMMSLMRSLCWWHPGPSAKGRASVQAAGEHRAIPLRTTSCPLSPAVWSLFTFPPSTRNNCHFPSFSPILPHLLPPPPSVLENASMSAPQGLGLGSAEAPSLSDTNLERVKE